MTELYVSPESYEDIMNWSTDLYIKKWYSYGIQPHTLPNAVGMWDEELRYFSYLLDQCDKDKHWVEIGAFCGGTACMMNVVKTMDQNPGDGKIISVDIDFNPMFDLNISRLNNKDLHIKLEIDSNNFATTYENEVETPIISFALIDGFHSFDQLTNDFIEIEPFLSKDAIVCFHDVSPYIFDKEYRDKRMNDSWENENWGTGEDFRLDEAILYTTMDKDWEILNRPKRFDCQHFQETGLQEWVRGKTSPFNSLVAIRRKNEMV